ncbi:MAG TPA: hypothetical protein VKU01_34180 [Bryobacteraceae bacterium]|nr:hypothetical protein [Bryobacteraceae bacterium]
MNPSFEVAKLRYPYGWGIRNYSGKPLIEQSGMIACFTTYMSIYPNERIYTVLLSRVESAGLLRIPKDMKSVLFGGQTSKPPTIDAIKIDASSLTAYTGQFTSKTIPIEQTLDIVDGKLVMRWGVGFRAF